MESYDTIEVHTDTIKAGDIIKCPDGKLRTVSKNYIKYDSFMGVSIFGGIYNIGYKKVLKVLNYKI